MNETVLALLCAIAIYGVSSLALPRPETDAPGDIADLSTDLDDSSVGDDALESRSDPAEIG